MADIPNPFELARKVADHARSKARDVCWIAGDLIAGIAKRVTDSWAQPGERDR